MALNICIVNSLVIYIYSEDVHMAEAILIVHNRGHKVVNTAIIKAELTLNIHRGFLVLLLLLLLLQGYNFISTTLWFILRNVKTHAPYFCNMCAGISLFIICCCLKTLYMEQVWVVVKQKGVIVKGLWTQRTPQECRGSRVCFLAIVLDPM